MRVQPANKRRQQNEQKSFGNNNDHNESHIFSHTVPKLIILEVFTVKKNVARGEGRDSGVFVFIYEYNR